MSSSKTLRLFQVSSCPMPNTVHHPCEALHASLRPWWRCRRRSAALLSPDSQVTGVRSSARRSQDADKDVRALDLSEILKRQLAMYRQPFTLHKNGLHFGFFSGVTIIVFLWLQCQDFHRDPL